MRPFGLAGAMVGLALLAPSVACAQTLGEQSAAMGVHDAAAGTGMSSGKIDRAAIKAQMTNSGNPSGSTCPLRVLADYGKRVASETAAKSSPKGAWESAGEMGSKGGGQGKSWVTASAASKGGTGGSGWSSGGGKGSAPAPRRR